MSILSDVRTVLVGVEAASAVTSATSLATASSTSSYIVRRGSGSLLGSIALAGTGGGLVNGFCGWVRLAIRILVGGVAFCQIMSEKKFASQDRRQDLPNSS
jgi:hypothetical protein